MLIMDLVWNMLYYYIITVVILSRRGIRESSRHQESGHFPANSEDLLDLIRINQIKSTCKWGLYSNLFIPSYLPLIIINTRIHWVSVLAAGTGIVDDSLPVFAWKSHQTPECSLLLLLQDSHSQPVSPGRNWESTGETCQPNHNKKPKSSAFLLCVYKLRH